MNKMDTQKFHTIYADPPWFESGGGVICRGAQKHYSLLKTPQIIEIMSDVLANIVEDNAHLYLWTTNTYLPEGLKVIEALGFRYLTCITWIKNQIGLGQYFRGLTEHCLFAVKGKQPYKYLENGKRAQGVTGFYSSKTGHSVKPKEIYDMIEKVSYPPYLELFARNTRLGWDSWGNEVETTIKYMVK